MDEINKTTSMQDIKRIHKFDQGSVFSVLIKTALPIVVLMFFNTMYAFVDSLMSSAYVNYGGGPVMINGVETQLNGGTIIGLIMPLMGFMIAFEVMVAVGVGLAYTQSLAQNKFDEAQERHSESMAMIIYIGLIVIVVMAIIGIPYILTVSGNWNKNSQVWVDSETGINYTHKMVMDGYLYMIVLTFAFIPMQLQQSFTRVLRAEGKGNIAALIPIATLPINIFFDWLFMHVFGFGIYGAGLATLIAASTGLLMMILYVYIEGNRDNLTLKIKMPIFKLKKAVAQIILLFAMGSLLRRVFDSLSMMIISLYVGNIHVIVEQTLTVPDWTGSWTVMTRSINMGSQLALGVAQAMSMLISYYMNSKQYDKVGETIKFGSLSMIVCAIFAFIILFGIQGILFNSYNPGHKFGWEWWNPISIAFIIALIYSIPVSLQPMAVMFYAGTRNPKLTLTHSLLFNVILLLFATLGITINYFTGIPVYLFVSMLIGAIIAFVSVITMFRIRYKQIMSN